MQSKKTNANVHVWRNKTVIDHTDCPVAVTVLLMEFERAKSALILESMVWCVAKEICWTSVKAFETNESIELVWLASVKKTEVTACEVAEEKENIVKKYPELQKFVAAR